MIEVTLKSIIKAIDDKLGEELEIIDVSELTPLANYYVICTASNSRRLNAIKEAVVEAVEKLGLSIHHVEGKSNSEWLLVDAHDIIVHILTPNERERLNFEELFKNQPHIDPASYLE